MSKSVTNIQQKQKKVNYSAILSKTDLLKC